MKRTVLWLLLARAALACSGAGSDSGTEGTTSTADGGAVIPSGATEIVVNEISAVGSSEWIELANKGSASFDLGGYGLADSDKSTGAPKTSDAMKFPTGTVLAAGAKLLVLLSKEDQPVGPHAKAECLANGPETCLFATWGLSASSGESTHLLTKEGAVVSSTAYPRNLGIDADAGQSACRLPDLTGDFATCAGTPGAVNAAP